MSWHSLTGLFYWNLSHGKHLNCIHHHVNNGKQKKNYIQINVDYGSYSAVHVIYDLYTLLRLIFILPIRKHCAQPFHVSHTHNFSLNSSHVECSSSPLFKRKFVGGNWNQFSCFHFNRKDWSVEMNLLQSIWHSNDIFTSNTSSACLIHSFRRNKTFNFKCFDVVLFAACDARTVAMRTRRKCFYQRYNTFCHDDINRNDIETEV